MTLRGLSRSEAGKRSSQHSPWRSGPSAGKKKWDRAVPQESWWASWATKPRDGSFHAEALRRHPSDPGNSLNVTPH